MVLTQFESRLEWYQDAMTGYFLYEGSNNRILLSKNPVGVVVAHGGVAVGAG